MSPLTRPDPDFLPPTPTHRTTVTSADGARLAVQIFEPGPVEHHAPTVVLVHGWTLSTTFWVRVVHRLRTGHRIVVYDQRGHGRSGPVPDGGFTPGAIAADLAAVLRAVLPDGDRAVVAGHSMGGMALVAFAARHPALLHERVCAALLVSTGMDQLIARMTVLPHRHPGVPPDGVPPDGVPPDGTSSGGVPPGGVLHDELAVGALRRSLTRTALGDARLLHRLPVPLARAALTRATMSTTATRAERAYCTDIVLSCPRRTYEEFAVMLGDLDLSRDLPCLDVPSGVLVGTRDRLTPPWHAERMAAALPACRRLDRVPGAGHMTPMTAPDDVARAVADLTSATVGRRGAPEGSGAPGVSGMSVDAPPAAGTG